MSQNLLPKLRRSITGQLDPQDKQFVWLYDSYRFSHQSVRLHRDLLEIVNQFNGHKTTEEMQSYWFQAGRGLLPSSIMNQLISALDEAMLIEGDAYQAALQKYQAGPARQPVCRGCYSFDRETLRRELDLLFSVDGGPGVPDFSAVPTRRLRGALIPHIDYARGNKTYGWGFKEVIEQSDAEVFVILGTSHFSPERFSLTRKDFATPLGVMKTDKNYVDFLAEHLGDAAFVDELAHVPEHSIELHVVLLQHLMQQAKREAVIVPLLIGSFHDYLLKASAPESSFDFRRLTDGLRLAEMVCPRKVCYLISGDLAHIGPKFGDPGLLTQQQLLNSQEHDQQLLQSMEKPDRGELFARLLEENDTRRICGFPPVYTFLSAVQPKAAQLLHYQQYVAPSRQESVSFATLVFYDE